MGSEVQAKADFTGVRYSQCWEDADILVEALDVQPGDVCLSIASAGDNAIVLLTRHPSRVIALDLCVLFVFGLVLVVRDDFLDALFVPARGELLFLYHFRFLRCRRLKAFLAFPRGS